MLLTTLLGVAAEKSAFKCFLGALHPGVVHFPIALLAAGALLEILQVLKKKKEAFPGTAALTYLAAAAAVPASVFGFMLADAEGAEGKMVDLHQWLGVASTVVALVAAACASKAAPGSRALAGLRIALIVGSGLVLATGYVGGELVFGENHLFKCFDERKPLQTPQAPTTPPTSTTPATTGGKVDFAKEIAPILKDTCFKCHGGEKIKGKFNLTSKKTAFAEAESGKAILPGKPTLSKMYTSMAAAKEDDDLMPPVKEKSRPSKEQIEKVRKWIEEGADWPDGFEFKK